MDFDAIDRNEPTFDELLLESRHSVLRSVGSPIDPIDWGVLAEKYAAFKDVVKEARTRGEVFGPVLVAAEGLTHLLVELSGDEGAEEGSRGGTAGGKYCSGAEAEVLSLVARMYTSLFQESPVPTEVAWRGRVAATFASPHPRELLQAVHEELQATRTPSYAAALADVALQSVAAADAGAASASPAVEDDGAFVEEAFKAFLRRCQTIGRRLGRSREASAAADRNVAGGPAVGHVKDMLAAFSLYLNSGTLEW